MNSKSCIYPSERCTADKKAKHFSHQCTSVLISEGWVHYGAGALWPRPFSSSCWKEYQFSFTYFACWTPHCQFSLHKSPKKLLDGNISHHWLRALCQPSTHFKSMFSPILWTSGTVTNLLLVLTDSYISRHSFTTITTNKPKGLPEGLGNDNILLNTILELLSAFFGFYVPTCFSGCASRADVNFRQ